MRDNPDIPHDIFTPEEAAEYLSCSRRTVERLMTSGEIPFSRVFTLPRIRRQDLDAYLLRTRSEASK